MSAVEQIGYIQANWATWVCARCAWVVPSSYRTEASCVEAIRFHIASHERDVAACVWQDVTQHGFDIAPRWSSGCGQLDRHDRFEMRRWKACPYCGRALSLPAADGGDKDDAQPNERTSGEVNRDADLGTDVSAE